MYLLVRKFEKPSLLIPNEGNYFKKIMPWKFFHKKKQCINLQSTCTLTKSNHDKDDSHWIHLYPYPPPPFPPSSSCTLRRSALVFYIPITISRDVIHVTDLFLYVFAICFSFTTNFGQIHSSVLKSSCFTYWYLSQFPEMLHMFIHLFMYHADLLLCSLAKYSSCTNLFGQIWTLNLKKGTYGLFLVR